MASSCCARSIAEFRLPIFSQLDTNGKIIHLEDSFAFKSKIIWLAKFVLVAFSVSGMAYDIATTDIPSFWLAYFTHWGEVFGTTYIVLSFMISIGWIPVTNSSGGATIWTKVVWGLFSGNFTSQMIIVPMFWFTVYDGNGVDYQILFGHGFLFLGIALDGLILNRTPVRVKQILFAYLIAGLYIVWTLIHGLATNIGNPINVDTDGDDDAIYSVLNWTARPLSTFITVALLMVVAAPICFFFFFVISLAIPRRYMSETKNESVEEFPDNV